MELIITTQETVFGIDFYYDIGGRIYPSDGSMYDRLPVAFIYIKYNLGLGLRVNDILATMIEASQISPNYGIYFSHWNCKLYQVEALVEEAGGYARAKYKYLKVNYTYSSSSTGDYPTLLVLSENGWINEEPILICTNKDIYDIHVIKTFPIEYNGTYRLILKGAKQYTIQIDEIFLIAINSTTNKGFKLPLIKAIHSSKGNIEKQIKSRNKRIRIFVTTNDIRDALTLYRAGAGYVILPHHLGGEKASVLLEEFAEKDFEELRKEREKNIEELKDYVKRGHT